MRAIVFQKYGGPEVLQLKEIDKPEPKDNELLIRIKGTSVNAADWRLRKADPWIVRLFLGFTKPRKQILGVAFSGEVESAGKKVNKYKIGDQVFGSSGLTLGAYAEYMCIRENSVIAHKPESIDHLQAATIPFGGSTALYYLRKVKINPGEKVLIYGASGAVGTAAIQIAKHFGAEITAVCSADNLQLVKSLGANHAIDYRSSEFSEHQQLYDVVFETVGKLSYSRCYKLTKTGGTMLLSAASLPQMINGLWTRIVSGKKVVSGVVSEKPGDMIYLKNLVEQGNYHPVIDRVYPLDQMEEAHRYVEKGHKKGNVAILVELLAAKKKPL